MNLFVLVFNQQISHVSLHLSEKRPAILVPEGHTRRFFLEMEITEFPPQFSMIPLLGFLDAFQIGFQLLLIRPGRTVDTL